MTLPLAAAAFVLALAAPAAAQTMDHGGMPGMRMPVPSTPTPTPTPAAPSEPRYADRVWGNDAMAASRTALRRDHGGGTFSQVVVDIFEYRAGDGQGGYRWDGEGWFGGDVDRFVVTSEGTGDIGRNGGGGVDDAEVQALYSRAIGPYFDVRAGVRQDVGRARSRTYATLGLAGLAPYWFEVEGAVFLSDRGDMLARLEGWYDQRITQRLILQPRIELNLAAQDVRADRIGSGLSDVAIDLRLRYEIAREFAPYIGVSWERKVGDTAGFARAAGRDAATPGVVFGIRAWF